MKISPNSYPIALFTKGNIFLLWNIIAAFSPAYLEALGIFKSCRYWDEYWLLHWFFFNFILELMRTTNGCADKPILPLTHSGNWQMVYLAEDCRGMRRMLVGEWVLLIWSQFLPFFSWYLVSCLLIFFFTLNWMGGFPLPMCVFPLGSTSLPIPTFSFLATENFVQTILGWVSGGVIPQEAYSLIQSLDKITTGKTAK